MSTGSEATAWSVLIPLKPLHMAKSRLLLPADMRQALVEAMALDVIEAVSGCCDVREVIIVSRDPLWRTLSVTRGSASCMTLPGTR